MFCSCMSGPLVVFSSPLHGRVSVWCPRLASTICMLPVHQSFGKHTICLDELIPSSGTNTVPSDTTFAASRLPSTNSNSPQSECCESEAADMDSLGFDVDARKIRNSMITNTSVSASATSQSVLLQLLNSSS